METKDKVNNQTEENNVNPQNNATGGEAQSKGAVPAKEKKSIIEKAAEAAGAVAKVAKAVSGDERVANVANMLEKASKGVTADADDDDDDANNATEGVAKVVGDVGKTAAKAAGKAATNVAGKAASGIFSSVAAFFTANLQAVLITAAIGATLSGVAYVVNDMLKPVKIEDTANIVQEIKKISEFTTACYYEESVIQDNKYTTKNHWFGNGVDTVENTIVLTVLCKVRAGYDLSAIADKDLVVKGDTVNIKLPAPKIFDVISNPSDYKIFEESGEWSHEEIVPMQVVRKEKILENALESNILDKANKIGKERVVTLFQSLGFNVVNVTLTDVPVREKAAAAPVVEEQPATVQPAVEPAAADSAAVAATEQPAEAAQTEAAEAN